MPKTQLEKLWLLGGTVVGFLLLLIGYVAFISPQRGQTSSVRAQVSSVAASNDLVKTRVAQLQQENMHLTQFQADLAQERMALPNTSGLPDFLRTLQSIGNATLANVTSLSVGVPADMSATNVATGLAKPSGPVGSAGGSRVYALPITATVSGTTDQLNLFLTQLQTVQPRAVLISQISENGGGATTTKGLTTLSLTMQAFVAPSSELERAQLSAASGK